MITGAKRYILSPPNQCQKVRTSISNKIVIDIPFLNDNFETHSLNILAWNYE